MSSLPQSTITLPVAIHVRIVRGAERKAVSKKAMTEFLLKCSRGMLERCIPPGQVQLAKSQLRKVREPFVCDTNDMQVERRLVSPLRDYALVLQMGLSAMISRCIDTLIDDEGRQGDTPAVDMIEGDLERALTRLERRPLQPEPIGEVNI